MTDITTRIYKDVFGLELTDKNVNKWLKAAIINFGDERGDIIVMNDNFGTKDKHADFTNGRKNAGLHPLQIVWHGLEMGKIFHEKYLGADDQIHTL